MKWFRPPGFGASGATGAPVTSVFGRIGAVIATLGDYAASLITNDSSVTGATVKDALDTLGARAERCIAFATTNLGQYSCAENSNTVASGFASHAEGALTRTGYEVRAFTIAAGGVTVTIAGDVTPDFAIGTEVRVTPTVPAAITTFSATTATGPVFAAGNTTFDLNAPLDLTTTAGLIVTSNGTGFTAGRAAHAEGDGNVAFGAFSHVEGQGCWSFSPGGHAEGGGTKCYGDEAHSEGETTRAYGIDTHVEGGSCTAMGFCAHAEGGAGASFGSIANGNASHVEGRNGRAGNVTRTFTKAAGGVTITIAGNVVSEFINGDRIPFVPITPREDRVAYQTIVTNPVFAAGNTTFDIDASWDTFTTGGLTCDSEIGTSAHVEGDGCLATGTDSHAQGVQCVATGQNSHAGGSQSVASGLNSTAQGDQCKASGIASWAEGQLTVASGQGAHAEGGGSTASGLYSHAEGIGTATGVHAHGEGSSNAQGTDSHAEGQGCYATATGSHAQGGLTLASGIYSDARGALTIAQGLISEASGTESKARAENDQCYAGGKFAADGDAQYRRSFIKGLTPGVGAGETVKLVSGSSTATSLEASKSYMLTLRGIATKTGLGAAARQSWAFHFEYSLDVTSAGVVTISAPVDMLAGGIVTGAAFVGATVTLVTPGANTLDINFNIAGGLTIASRIAALLELVEVLGT